MVTQLTPDRIHLLTLQALYWTGPMSIALYVKPNQLPGVVTTLRGMDNVLLRTNIDLHLVIKSPVSSFVSCHTGALWIFTYLGTLQKMRKSTSRSIGPWGPGPQRLFQNHALFRQF